MKIEGVVISKVDIESGVVIARIDRRDRGVEG
jgi:hypothetical protein